MPEGPEVKIASTYFNSFFQKSKKIQFEIITDYYQEKYSQVFDCIKNKLQTYNPSYTIGKNIFINLDKTSVFNFHLGMTGGWSLRNAKHCHFRIFNESKELFFRDVRKFGKMRIISNKQLKEKHNAEFDLLHNNYNFKNHIDFLCQNISPKKSVCSILMDQKYFPGVGNYIKSESLYITKTHPEEKWVKLTQKEVQNLIFETQRIMTKSYQNGGAELKDFKNPFHESLFTLKIYGKTHTQKKDKIISQITSDQRKTWWCPKIQKLKR